MSAKQKAEDRVLTIAISKARHFEKLTWCGCFTPVEILALVAIGAKPTRPYDLQGAEDRKSKGESGPIWFYFVPTGGLQKLLGEVVAGRVTY